MVNLDYSLCSANDCNFKVDEKKGCIDNKDRQYCSAECAYLSLEREGIEFPTDFFFSIRNQRKDNN
jgi:hypothetical protein